MTIVNPHAELTKDELVHLLYNAHDRIERLEAIARELLATRAVDPTRMRSKGVRTEDLEFPRPDGIAPWARVTTLEMDRRARAKE